MEKRLTHSHSWDMILLLLITFVQFTKGEDILVCGSDTLDISCPNGEVLVFESAFYGRDDGKTCGSDDKYIQADTPCKVTSAVGALNKNCFRKTTCHLQPDTIFQLQQDPCTNTVKYLRAKYACVAEHHIHTICTSYYYHKQSGYIISTNYPQDYNANLKCSCEIQKDMGSHTRLTLLDLDMEARTRSKGCLDWVIAYNKDNPSTDAYSYCGALENTKEPTSVTFSNAVLKVKTDERNQRRGFLVKVEAVEMGPHGQLEPVRDSGSETDDRKIEELKKQLAQLEGKQKANPKPKTGKILKKSAAEQNINTNFHENKEEPPINHNGKVNEGVKDTNNIDQLHKVKERVGDQKQVRKEKDTIKIQLPEPEELIKDPMKEHEQWGKSNKGAIIADGCVHGSIALPEHSHIVSFKEGRKLQIDCTQNYQMDDEDKGLFVCHDDKWAGQFPICLTKNCKIPDTPLHGEVIYRKLSVGNDIEYMCHRGYTLDGEHTSTCLSDGQWSGYPPKCIESGSRSLSILGEFLVAILMTCLFFYFKKRLHIFSTIPRIIGGVYIKIGQVKNAFDVHQKEAVV